MKKTLAILAALLVAALPTVSIFASCEKEEEETEVTPPVDEKAAFSVVLDDPAAFEGKTFSALIGSSGNVMYAEEENGDPINDAVYRRNKLIEEHFGITLNIVKSGFGGTGDAQQEATAQFRSLIEAGDQTYHMFTHVQHTGMPQMILEKFFVDWNTIPHVKLEEEWWYQNIENDLCFGNKIYVMTGDYARYIDTVDCLVFNKDIFDDLGLEYPYQDVLAGTWTWDKFTELVKQGAKDLNGDGLMNPESDQYGLVGWVYELGPALLVSSGYAPLTKDADNMPVLNENVDEAHEIYQKIVDVFVDGQSAWAAHNYGAGEYTLYNQIFSEGRAMFKDTFLSGIPGLKEVEFDFGILPYPKWSEDAPYYNRSSNMTAMTYIPVTNNDLDLTGAVLEELAYQSSLELTPLYFDTVLTVKSTRDVESEEMLPIIKNTARFLYDGYAPSINGSITSKSNSYSSSYASNLPAYRENLEEMRELLLAE